MDLFVVDLDKLTAYEHLEVVLMTFALSAGHRCVDDVKDVIEHIRHDSFHLAVLQVTDHGVSLAASCLPVREHSPVVPGEAVLYELIGSGGVDFLLLRILVEDFIEAESFILARNSGLLF